MYPDSYYTKENIAQRIVKRSAELWGYDEASLDQFDPLVKLLIEACSVEFEKIGQEVRDTELRLMTRLAEILCPEIKRNPQPALAIAQTRAVEAMGWIDQENQLVCRRTHVRQGETPEVFFSPVGKYSIVNAGIACYATPAGLYSLEKGFRNLLTPAMLQKGGEQSVWIGLDIDPSILTWEGFRFYIDWPGDAAQGLYREFLPFTEWESQLGTLTFDTGLKTNSSPEDMTLTGINNHFINITSEDKWEKGKLPLLPYPQELEENFDRRSLQTLKKPLAWLKIKWSAAFPAAGFDNLKIALNAFPILNKQLHKLTYRLQPGLNGIALPSGEAFIGINTIVNQKNQVYSASDKKMNSNESGTGNSYTLRQLGVGRLDQRTAKASLYQLMELLRDEVTAFNAIGEDYLASLLREISQNMAKVEQKLGIKRTSETSSQPFLVIKGDKNPDHLTISYWTTSSELANGLPAGSKLQSYAASSMNNAETLLITTAAGGKPAPEESEYVSELRKNIITHGRLITAEDIRTYCMAELGNKIKNIHVRPHFIQGNLPGQGFIRCLQIQLTPTNSFKEYPDWVPTCDLLKAKIEKLSTGMYPVQVILI